MLYPTELRGHIMKWLREIATGAGALAMTLSDTLTEKRPRNETKRSLRGRLSAAPASSNEVRARRRGHAPALRILQKYLREIAAGASALAMILIPAQNCRVTCPMAKKGCQKALSSGRAESKRLSAFSGISSPFMQATNWPWLIVSCASRNSATSCSLARLSRRICVQRA